MGNKGSAQTFPTEAVTAQVVRTLNTFAPLYIKAMAVSALRLHQRAHDEELAGVEKVANKEGFLLERPPLASEPMERGWVTKLGEIKKTWKRRFFVATEEADNFVVFYFEKDRDAGTAAKAKGSIYPCGYIVSVLSPEEDTKDKDAGAFGLKLEPLDRKRTWYLRFDSEETRQTWKQVLQYASLKCEAPLSDDPLLADAFREAYRRTRRQMGLRGYYRLDRCERDQLIVLASQVCENGALASIYESIASAAAAATSGPGSPSAGGSGASAAAVCDAKGAAEAEKLKVAVDRELDRIVTAIVDTAWPAMQARAEVRKDPVFTLAKSSLGSILREEEMRLAEVRERTARHIRPVARDAAGPMLPIVLGALLKPLYKVRSCVTCVSQTRVHACTCTHHRFIHARTALR